jgi:succinylglutamate desuccinylase
LRPQAIKASIRYVESQLTRAKEGKFNLLQALSLARDLENAVLERVFSRLTVLAPKEIRPVLMDVTAETERHRKTIIEALDIERR